MGRGRQKAKHTKIARELKSFSPEVNYGELERELTGHAHADDPYSKWTEYETEDPAKQYQAEDQPKRA